MIPKAKVVGDEKKVAAFGLLFNSGEWYGDVLFFLLC